MHWRRKWQPTPVLPGESPGRRSLVCCHLWGRTESDTTERLHFHFSLSCIGEGNSNPLQYCLENPRDGEACWAAVYGVAESRIPLKRLSSSSSLEFEDVKQRVYERFAGRVPVSLLAVLRRCPRRSGESSAIGVIQSSPAEAKRRVSNWLVQPRQAQATNLRCD